MKKIKPIIIFGIILTLIFSTILFTSCDKNKPPTKEFADDDYTLTLSNLVDKDGNQIDDVVIKKSDIRALFKTKPVIHDDTNPVVASDKQDDDGNLIPHTLKGVYLEDLLAQYTTSGTIDKYASMTLSSTDGYVTVVTEDVFNSDLRGSKMIIALEYDGNVLNPNAKSGALRAIFPNQIANGWAKYLNKIEFSSEMLKTPTVYSLHILETLNFETYGGSYTEETEDVVYTYSGLKISKLIGEDNILKGVKSVDKLSAVAWDFNSDTGKFNEYKTWVTYDVYNEGYLLTSGTLDTDDAWTLTRTPILDGPTYSDGMTVKNILSISVFHSAIVSLETAMKRYDADADGFTDDSFKIKDLLLLLNMFDKDTDYIVTKLDGTKIEVSNAQMSQSIISKSTESTYVISYGDMSFEFKTIDMVI